MARILAGLRRPLREKYDLWKLVDHRFFDDPGRSNKSVQIICDIDKTYLETEFESLVKMAKIAFEDAADKVTVDGASIVLKLVRWGLPDAEWSDQERSKFPRPLHFVSSSPPQLRRVLEEKLKLDGLDWTSDTFKNQVYNIRKGRFDLIKNQVAYKTAAILRIVEQAPRGSEFHMIGDNAESDPMVYLGIKLFLEKKLTRNGYKEYLLLAGVEEAVATDLFAQLPDEFDATVKSIYIRRLAQASRRGEHPLEVGLCFFDNFIQAAFLMVANKLIDAGTLFYLVRAFHNLQAHCIEDIIANLNLLAMNMLEGEEQTLALGVAKGLAAMAEGRGKSAEGVFRFAKDLELGEKEILNFMKSWKKPH